MKVDVFLGRPDYSQLQTCVGMLLGKRVEYNATIQDPTRDAFRLIMDIAKERGATEFTITNGKRIVFPEDEVMECRQASESHMAKLTQLLESNNLRRVF